MAHCEKGGRRRHYTFDMCQTKSRLQTNEVHITAAWLANNQQRQLTLPLSKINMICNIFSKIPLFINLKIPNSNSSIQFRCTIN